MNTQKTIFLALSVLMLSSCASRYKTINPETVNYGNITQDKNFSLSYKYGVLQNRYAKKESKKLIRLLAVKMSNNSGRDLVFGKDIKLKYTNNNDLTLVDGNLVYNEVKQGTLIYLLYLLLTPATLKTTTNGIETNSIPIGYALGPGLTLGNMASAGTANGNFRKDLQKYMIESGSVIKNGETRFGLVALRSDNYDTINVKIE
jgi:hypothetical protein